MAKLYQLYFTQKETFSILLWIYRWKLINNFLTEVLDVINWIDRKKMKQKETRVFLSYRLKFFQI